jgi:hypothetical protein
MLSAVNDSSRDVLMWRETRKHYRTYHCRDDRVGYSEVIRNIEFLCENRYKPYRALIAFHRDLSHCLICVPKFAA